MRPVHAIYLLTCHAWAMSITETLLLLTTALGLSFGIERVLETVKGLIKRVGLQRGPAAEARSQAIEQAVMARRLDAFDAVIEQTSARLAEALAVSDGTDARAEAVPDVDAARDRARNVARDLQSRLEAIDPALLSVAHKRRRDALLVDVEALASGRPPRSHEAAERYPPITVLLEPARPPDAEKTAQAFWLQIIGTFGGIVVCFVADFGLFDALGVFQGVRPAIDYTLTGVLIGSGSQPIHVLIKFLDQRGLVDLQAPAVPSTSDETSEPAAAEAAAASATTPEVRLRVPYAGGVDPALVARRQPTREAPPDVVVFHHTAMHSDTTFDDVVRVIQDQRGWATAYHCVILADGSIHPFCRWDYVGNHARGANFRSIGIALNGNFETNASTPGANDRGQFGLRTPSDAQLESAARVTALWCHLYDIPLDFPSDDVAPGIVPHKVVKPTACPGSNFPTDRFAQQVRAVHARWATDDVAQAEIAQFKQKARIYPEVA
jgi:hypothetical protein